jgi:hypothetical protein
MNDENEGREYNPYLRETFLEVVENQLRINKPPEARETLKRLVDQGISEEDAKIYIAQAVAIEVYDALANKKPYNAERYTRNLRRLPEEPEE